MAKAIGSAKTGGRKKGTPNKRSLGFGEILSERGIDLLDEVLNAAARLPERERVNVYLSLLPYQYPKRKPSETSISFTDHLNQLNREQMRDLYHDLARKLGMNKTREQMNGFPFTRRRRTSKTPPIQSSPNRAFISTCLAESVSSPCPKSRLSRLTPRALATRFTWATLRGLVRVPIKAKRKLKYGELTNHYFDLAKQLSAQNPKVLEKTSAEKEVAAALKSIGSCHLLTSCWVGRKNLDLLLLGLTGSAHGNGTRFTGAMIEVDGLVHTYAPKLLGDGDKDSLVSLLGILPVRIQNDQVRQARIFEMLQKLCVYTSIDTRARDRLKARIHLVTLFLNWNFEHLGAVFGFDHEKAIEKIAARLTEVGQ